MHLSLNWHLMIFPTESSKVKIPLPHCCNYQIIKKWCRWEVQYLSSNYTYSSATCLISCSCYMIKSLIQLCLSNMAMQNWLFLILSFCLSFSTTVVVCWSVLGNKVCSFSKEDMARWRWWWDIIMCPIQWFSWALLNVLK